MTDHATTDITTDAAADAATDATGDATAGVDRADAHDPRLPGSSARPALTLVIVTAVLVLVLGVALGATITEWLLFGLAAGLILWVGGAITGQVLLAHLLATGTSRQVLTLVRQIMWIVPRLYVPAGTIGVACGLALVARGDLGFGHVWVWLPTALYVATAAAGTAISAPGYTRLIRLAAGSEATPDTVRWRRDLMRLAWLNRVELAAVVLALLLIIVRPGS